MKSINEIEQNKQSKRDLGIAATVNLINILLDDGWVEELEEYPTKYSRTFIYIFNDGYKYKVFVHANVDMNIYDFMLFTGQMHRLIEPHYIYEDSYEHILDKIESCRTY